MYMVLFCPDISNFIMLFFWYRIVSKVLIENLWYYWPEERNSSEKETDESDSDSEEE